MLKLKLQYFDHLMQRGDSLEKMLGKIDRGWVGWMASLTQWTWANLSKLWEIVKDREAWLAVVRGNHKSLDMTEQLNNFLSEVYGTSNPWGISGFCGTIGWLLIGLFPWSLFFNFLWSASSVTTQPFVLAVSKILVTSLFCCCFFNCTPQLCGFTFHITLVLF